MKYLIITRNRDCISNTYKRKVKENRHCQVYDKDGRLVYPETVYDGEDREWAKEFIKHHKVGESVNDAQVWFMRNYKWDYDGSLRKEEE